MQIIKAAILAVTGISIIIFAVHSLSWKTPPYILNVKVGARQENVQFASLNESGNGVSVSRSRNLAIVISKGNSNVQEEEKEKLIAEWNSLNPEVLLIERKIKFFLPIIMNPVKKFGLAGFAREIANEKNTEVYTYDLPALIIAEKLLEKYPAEQTAMAMILYLFRNQICEENQVSTESTLRECINEIRNSYSGSPVKSVYDFEKIWERDFPGVNWRSENSFKGYAGEILSEIKDIRKKHISLVVSYFIEGGKRVLAVIPDTL